MKTKQKFSYLADGSLDIQQWLKKIQLYYTSSQLEIIQKAINLASNESQGLTTFYGLYCLEQGIEMGDIIAELKLDQDAVAAAILASTIQHIQLNLEVITLHINENVAKLVRGVSQMNALNALTQTEKTKNQIQLDRLRKAFFAMASDIRVILIKLAERASIMRGIKNINPNERKRLAQETMDIYAPLANRLGIGTLKWELEDLAFHYINPEMYKNIATHLAERRTERQQRINNIINQLQENLTKSHIQAKISGRAKHIYSIYLKMQQKELDLKNIYDYSAVRILVPTLQDCYTALSVTHHLWEHLPNEFDDYIINPKPNGYRSIHTALIDEDGKNFEVQIRTSDMHEEAEHGIAAHWIYKEKKPQQAGYEDKIVLLRQLLAWHEDLAKTEELPEQHLEKILEDNVYILTPLNEIIELSAGSTPLDFAYHIHTELGHRCRGAKVNGHIVPLTYQLKTSDRVEIITTKTGTPSRDWLRKDSHYISTSRARAKVAQWFKHHDHEQELKLATPVSHAPGHKPTLPISTNLQAKKPISSTSLGFEVGHTPNLLTRIARCCKPIPGDAIIGYITQGRGVSIHKQKCSNINQAKLDKEHKLIDVSWDEKHSGGYYVDLQIRAYGREQIIKEITSLLANAKIGLVMLNSTINKIDDMTSIVITIQIHSLLQLTQLITQIQHLSQVIEVKRINT